MKSHIPCQKIVLTHDIAGTNVETLAISIKTQDTELRIINIYRNPNHTRHSRLNPDRLFSYCKTHPTLIGGDFNAHHTVSTKSEYPKGNLGLTALFLAMVTVLQFVIVHLMVVMP